MAEPITQPVFFFFFFFFFFFVVVVVVVDDDEDTSAVQALSATWTIVSSARCPIQPDSRSEDAQKWQV